MPLSGLSASQRIHIVHPPTRIPNMRCAVLDDYQSKAHNYADWASLERLGVTTTFFTDILGRNPLPDAAIPELVERLKEFDVVVCMRERTPMPRLLLEQLPNLKLLFTTGMGNASFDIPAATSLGIVVCGTSMLGTATSELTWALILALLRKIPQEDHAFKFQNGWQSTIGFQVRGKTLGIIGLGRLGTEVARVGVAFGMKVQAWSPNLTLDRVKATKLPVELAPSLDSLLESSDIISLHLVLSERTRNLLSRSKLSLLKPTAFLINTSRGALIDQEALCDAIESHQIAGAALDTFVEEPVPLDARIRKVAREHADRVVITPHIGYVEEENYKVAYSSAVASIAAWARGGWTLPIRGSANPNDPFLSKVLNKNVVPKHTVPVRPKL